MKHLPLILVVLGVGLAAAFGGRNAEDLMERQRTLGLAKLLAGKASAAGEALCGAAADADAKACAAGLEATAKAMGEGKSWAEASKALALTPEGRQGAPPSKATSEARDAWRKALLGRMEAEAAVKALPAAGGPGARLSGWFSVAGLPFLLGLGLIALGGGLARKQQTQAATGPAQGGAGAVGGDPGGDQPADFGALLASTQGAVAALGEEMAAKDAPVDADFDAAQARVEDLQAEKLEVLVDARDRVQARLGMAGFAAVFGPLAAGERNLNRTWSALVDRHWPEASASAIASAAFLAEAQAELDKHTSA